MKKIQRGTLSSLLKKKEAPKETDERKITITDGNDSPTEKWTYTFNNDEFDPNFDFDEYYSWKKIPLEKKFNLRDIDINMATLTLENYPEYVPQTMKKKIMYEKSIAGEVFAKYTSPSTFSSYQTDIFYPKKHMADKYIAEFVHENMLLVNYEEKAPSIMNQYIDKNDILRGVYSEYPLILKVERDGKIYLKSHIRKSKVNKLSKLIKFGPRKGYKSFMDKHTVELTIRNIEIPINVINTLDRIYLEEHIKKGEMKPDLRIVSGVFSNSIIKTEDYEYEGDNKPIKVSKMKTVIHYLNRNHILFDSEDEGKDVFIYFSDDNIFSFKEEDVEQYPSIYTENKSIFVRNSHENVYEFNNQLAGRIIYDKYTLNKYIDILVKYNNNDRDQLEKMYNYNTLPDGVEGRISVQLPFGIIISKNGLDIGKQAYKCTIEKIYSTLSDKEGNYISEYEIVNKDIINKAFTTNTEQDVDEEALEKDVEKITEMMNNMMQEHAEVGIVIDEDESKFLESGQRTEKVAEGYNPNEYNFIRSVLPKNITLSNENVIDIKNIMRQNPNFSKTAIILMYANKIFPRFSNINVTKKIDKETLEKARKIVDDYFIKPGTSTEYRLGEIKPENLENVKQMFEYYKIEMPEIEKLDIIQKIAYAFSITENSKFIKEISIANTDSLFFATLFHFKPDFYKIYGHLITHYQNFHDIFMYLFKTNYVPITSKILVKEPFDDKIKEEKEKEKQLTYFDNLANIYRPIFGDNTNKIIDMVTKNKNILEISKEIILIEKDKGILDRNIKYLLFRVNRGVNTITKENLLDFFSTFLSEKLYYYEDDDEKDFTPAIDLYNLFCVYVPGLLSFEIFKNIIRKFKNIKIDDYGNIKNSSMYFHFDDEIKMGEYSNTLLDKDVSLNDILFPRDKFLSMNKMISKLVPVPKFDKHNLLDINQLNYILNNGIIEEDDNYGMHSTFGIYLRMNNFLVHENKVSATFTKEIKSLNILKQEFNVDDVSLMVKSNVYYKALKVIYDEFVQETNIKDIHFNQFVYLEELLNITNPLSIIETVGYNQHIIIKIFANILSTYSIRPASEIEKFLSDNIYGKTNTLIGDTYKYMNMMSSLVPYADDYIEKLFIKFLKVMNIIEIKLSKKKYTYKKGKYSTNVFLNSKKIADETKRKYVFKILTLLRTRQDDKFFYYNKLIDQYTGTGITLNKAQINIISYIKERIFNPDYNYKFDQENYEKTLDFIRKAKYIHPVLKSYRKRKKPSKKEGKITYEFENEDETFMRPVGRQLTEDDDDDEDIIIPDTLDDVDNQIPVDDDDEEIHEFHDEEDDRRLKRPRSEDDRRLKRPRSEDDIDDVDDGMTDKHSSINESYYIAFVINKDTIPGVPPYIAMRVHSHINTDKKTIGSIMLFKNISSTGLFNNIPLDKQYNIFLYIKSNTEERRKRKKDYKEYTISFILKTFKINLSLPILLSEIPHVPYNLKEHVYEFYKDLLFSIVPYQTRKKYMINDMRQLNSIITNFVDNFEWKNHKEKVEFKNNIFHFYKELSEISKVITKENIIMIMNEEDIIDYYSRTRDVPREKIDKIFTIDKIPPTKLVNTLKNPKVKDYGDNLSISLEQETSRLSGGTTVYTVVQKYTENEYRKICKQISDHNKALETKARRDFIPDIMVELCTEEFLNRENFRNVLFQTYNVKEARQQLGLYTRVYYALRQLSSRYTEEKVLKKAAKLYEYIIKYPNLF